ncbi:DUF6044 family protein [Lachnospiraceae bacterium OttesenSCG-928-D06]|nr:DUF6044 family protein [Lachnospiraceae bacterium OttesenSCG-928-D06]
MTVKRNEKENIIKKAWKFLNKTICECDQKNLWWMGLIVLTVLYVPFFILGEGSIFEIHDQLDETLLSYVFTAKYMGTGIEIFPEMLGGINASGMQPSAILFVPLYKILPVFYAFLVQYFIVCASGFYGMYFCLRRLLKGALLPLIIASLFCLLPIQSVYGLSILGVPLLLYAVMCLADKENLLLSFLILFFFGTTTHLVLIGYVVLSFYALYLFYCFFKRKNNVWLVLGFVFLTGIYLIVNRTLIYEFLVGQDSYVSHREELMNYASPFLQTVKSVFLESAQHAPSYHKYLIVPVIGILTLAGVCYKKLKGESKALYKLAMINFTCIILITCLYGLCRSVFVVDLKNSMSGFLRYFQMERYYFLYPTLWYLEIGLLLGIVWKENIPVKAAIKLLCIFLILLPTLQLLKVNSILYWNVNQINNGSNVTGYISFESYYGEDLMSLIDETIGLEKESYRIAHLGISPAPSLMYGFYTIDGYSNNYPLAYKHEFRKIIEKELEENEENRIYFDGWGSRAYLFNKESGSYMMIGKKNQATYSNLSLDTKQMQLMGCRYLFSGGEILNEEELGLTFKGYFETENSYFGIWLYELAPQ